jgi:two-component sensor histidine kinase
MNGVRWVPLPLDHVLNRYGLGTAKVQLLLLAWMLLIAVSLYVIPLSEPTQALLASSSRKLYYSYLTQIPLLIGTLLLFWVGFEWGFIPVFLSAFVVAFLAHMMPYWALLYGISHILGLAIYGLAYYCVPLDTSLRTLSGFAFFTVVSFIAALAGSLGSFVWSQYFQLSAFASMHIWKIWWTSAFLQSMILVAPILAVFTPKISQLRSRYFPDVPNPKVTLSWIYAAIGSVTIVLILFIMSAKSLGSQSLLNQMATLSSSAGQAMKSANESFEIVTWISIGLILTVGTGGIFLVGSWNKSLQKQVDRQTLELQENEAKLKTALDERDLLLNEIHNRVNSNLTLTLALLELQLKTRKDKTTEEVIKDSHSRIRSLAIVHETMYQNGSVSSVNLKNYTIKLSNRLRQSFLNSDQHIDVTINAENIALDIDRAVPFAMVLNELMVNAFSHAFKNLTEGSLFIEIRQGNGDILLSVCDNGNGLPEEFKNKDVQSFGMKLVLTLTRQLHGTFQITDHAKPCFSLRIPLEVPATEQP